MSKDYRGHYYIGIDPGLTSGGIVVIDGDGKVDSEICLKDCDKYAHETVVKQFLDKIPYADINTVCIEEISPSGIFGASKSACSKLYASYRSILAILHCMGIGYRTVNSKMWQAHFEMTKGLKSKERKDRLLDKAATYWPMLPSYPMKDQRQLCDAYLIARYGRDLAKG